MPLIRIDRNFVGKELAAKKAARSRPLWDPSNPELWKKAANYVTSGEAWHDSTNTIADAGKSVWRTITGENWSEAAKSPQNKRMSAYRNAALSDTLNWASIIPLISSGSKATAPAAESLMSRLTPKADFSNYVLHGGPTPENLVGGVVNPDYVRGGLKSLSSEPSLINEGSPNWLEDQYIVDKFKSAKAALANDMSKRKFFQLKDLEQLSPAAKLQAQQDRAATLEAAQSYVDRHGEIFRRVNAGEQHGTGVSHLSPQNAYSGMGATHVLDVPPELQTSDIIPGGEIKFWGQHKPVASILKENQGEGFINVHQAVVDAADIKSLETQRLANAIAKLRGTKISPAYKQRVIDFINESFGGSNTMPVYVKNPQFGDRSAGGNGLLEWISDYGAQEVPKITNYDEIIQAISSAKTQDDVINAIKSMKPNEQIDIMLNRSRRPNFASIIEELLKKSSTLAGDYSRLGRIR